MVIIVLTLLMNRHLVSSPRMRSKVQPGVPRAALHPRLYAFDRIRGLGKLCMTRPPQALRCRQHSRARKEKEEALNRSAKRPSDPPSSPAAQADNKPAKRPAPAPAKR